MALRAVGDKQDVLRTSFSLFFFISTRAFAICLVTDNRGTGTGVGPQEVQWGGVGTESGTGVERNCFSVLLFLPATVSQPPSLVGFQNKRARLSVCILSVMLTLGNSFQTRERPTVQ